jgi:16S rRNA G966 N2-methylase RsmD
MTDLGTNVLYYGDNLDILRRYLPDAAVDLVYLDPPFNSNRDYNVIFRDESGNATMPSCWPVLHVTPGTMRPCPRSGASSRSCSRM